MTKKNKPATQFYDLRFLSSNPGFRIQIKAMVMPEKFGGPMPLEGSGKPGAPVWASFVNHRLTLKGDDPDFLDKFERLTDQSVFSLKPERGAMVWPDPSDSNWLKTGLFIVEESTVETLVPTAKAMDLQNIGENAAKARDLFANTAVIDEATGRTSSGAFLDPEVTK